MPSPKQIKIASLILLVVYVAVLIWLVLFKLTFTLSAVLDLQRRSLNLIPFAAPKMVNGQVSWGEMILNCVLFIPFGLLLNVNVKKARFSSKLLLILLFSLAAEVIQYSFAIGATDVTDLMTNTFGGYLGLKLYDLGKQYVRDTRLDAFIVAAGALLFVFFITVHVSHFVLHPGR
ncbi:VanZ family protein [Spirosoma rigui]|uniref:VanZ family protein n=1 Tax=Spirosoma rigui TaxID=564064 RepID=UPI0009AF5993|nr:VanZ family protein [Spirosoma rigui]